ncbi:MAG: AAA family ATPase [Patescibacteria group bacterium]
MPKMILFLGVQLSGKSTLAKKIAEIEKIKFVSIDGVRTYLFGRLSGPKDWTDDYSEVFFNSQTRTAYDYLFKIIKLYLDLGLSLVVEMPHLGDRESLLREIIMKTSADFKVIWCYISQDSDEEIKKRINLRSGDAAPVRIEDYRMFKNKIKKPEAESLEVDTSLSFEQCLHDISRYLL